MALPGIPISENECIGDSLQTINNALTSLDALVGTGGSSVTSGETAPTSPSEGDLWFDTSTGILYVYYNDGNSSQWVGIGGGGGGASVTVSETAPTSPSDGDLWFDSSSGILSVYYNDGNSSQWVGIGGGGGASVTVSETAPTSPSEGDLWYNPSSGVLSVYYNDGNSSQWVDVGGGDSAFAFNVQDSDTVDLTWNSSTNTLSADVVDSSITNAKIAFDGGSFAFRNKIINGDMRIDQRNSGAIHSYTVPNYYGSCDRWAIIVENSPSNVGSAQRIATSSTEFPFALRLQRTQSSTSTETIYIGQVIESWSVYDLAGQTITVSFYAAKGANFSATNNQLNLQILTGTGADQGWHVLSSPGNWTGTAVPGQQTYTLTSTLTKYTLTATIPSNAKEVCVRFNYVPTGTAGADDYVDITGVQLEKGNSATPFEHRPIGSELALCQRYYELVGMIVDSNRLVASETYADSSQKNTWFFREIKRTSSPTFTVLTSSANFVPFEGIVVPVDLTNDRWFHTQISTPSTEDEISWTMGVDAEL